MVSEQFLKDSEHERLRSRANAESAHCTKEEERIRRLQLYENMLKRLPQLNGGNWMGWLAQVKRMTKQLRIVDVDVFCEAALYYCGSQEVVDELFNRGGRSFVGAEEMVKAVRKVYLSSREQQFAVVEINKLQQLPQESLFSYLARFEALRFLHPAVDAAEGDNQLRAALIGGLNGTARQFMKIDDMAKSLDEVIKCLGRCAESEIWSGYKTLAVPIPPVEPRKMTVGRKDFFPNIRKQIPTEVYKAQRPVAYCYKCGWAGHKAKECDGKATRPGPGLVTEEQKRVFYENKRKKDEVTPSNRKVPEKSSQGKEKRSATAVSVMSNDIEHSKDDMLFTVEVCINGVFVKALADSGAVVNVKIVF